MHKAYDYPGYNRLPISRITNNSDVNNRAYNAMVSLGFQAIEFHCVFKGDVKELVAKLKSLGWKRHDHPTNPFLLEHEESHMLFNYAKTKDEPSKDFISWFSGK
jgi:hypothetical protein